MKVARPDSDCAAKAASSSGRAGLFGIDDLVCLGSSRLVGDVAQLVEHLLCKQGVVGSIPSISTIKMNGGLGPQAPACAGQSPAACLLTYDDTRKIGFDFLVCITLQRGC